VGTYDYERRANAGKRYNGKCKSCSRMHTAVVLRRTENVKVGDEWAYSYLTDQGETLTSAGISSMGPAATCVCGKRVKLMPVKGVYNPDVVCNAKCTASKGFNCECSCGGKNHGSGGISH